MSQQHAAETNTDSIAPRTRNSLNKNSLSAAAFVPLQAASIQDQIQQVIGDVLAFVPSLVAALVILIVGWIIGRLLGGLVTRVLENIGVSQYARGTPLDRDGGGGIASAVGKLFKFYVYFLALLAAANVLQIQILSELLSDIGTYLPVILGAAIILVIGFIIGSVVGDIIADVVGGFGLNSFVRDTPLEGAADSAGGVGEAVGSVIEYYIYFLALLAAAEALQIPALSRLLNSFAGYLPALIGGLVILVIGILVAEFLADMVGGVDASRATNLAGLAVKLFVYYITITIALNTMGFATTVLTNLFLNRAVHNVTIQAPDRNT